jgi:hypothetical protein
MMLVAPKKMAETIWTFLILLSFNFILSSENIVSVDLQTVIHAYFFGMFMICLHTKLKNPSSNGLLFSAVKRKAK